MDELGLAILTSISIPRTTDALQTGSSLPDALTHGFKGGFVAAACMCALALIVAVAALPGRPQKTKVGEAQLTALSSARCPAAPQGGHLARLAAARRRLTRVANARTGT